MPKFFISTPIIEGSSHISYNGPDLMHIKQALRIKVGENIVFCDNKNKEYVCKVQAIFEDHIDLSVLESYESKAELPYEIYLYQGLVKNSKMELVLQKTVELGLTHFVPVIMERCVIKSKDSSKDKKKLRFENVVKSAAEQCGRAILPKVLDVQTFDDAIKHAAHFENSLCFVPWEAEKDLSLKQFLRETLMKNKGEIPGSVHIFIGPEGGFSLREIVRFKENDIRPITLGPRILRTETAAFVTLAQLNYELE